MSRRGRGEGGASVRGPTSALTSFLAGLGVEPNYNQGTLPNRTSPSPQPVVSIPGTLGTADSLPDQSRATPDKTLDSDDLDGGPPTKRPRALSVDSDDLDAVPVASTSISSASGSGLASLAVTPGSSRAVSSVPQATVPRSNLKSVGEFMNCGECGKKFTVTPYTKEHPIKAQSWLCLSCCPKLGVDPYARVKKPKATKAAVKKEARTKVVHYEETRGVKPLGDMCIQLIGKYIEDVEQLGDIGGVNMDKVCKIISKGRRLTPETAQLFYSAERHDLTMYDCTGLVHESYLAMANLCPNLRSLHLDLCGQLQTDSVIAWGLSLRHLRCLELYGPFLVRQEGWINFFEAVGRRLEGFLVTQSPRIDLETIEALVDNCPNLTQLRLSEIGRFNGDFVSPIAKLSNLRLLEITSPGTSLSDDLVETLLAAIGKHITSIDLSDNPALSDGALNAIAAHCPNLEHLALRNADLSDSAVANFFNTLAAAGRPGLIDLDLEKGHDMCDSSLRAIVAHSGKTIQRLSIVGWKDVDKEAVSELASCPKLQDLDLSWCRNVTDFTIKDILEGCCSLREIRVWGCNHLTDAVPRKRGVRVIGIETHSI